MELIVSHEGRVERLSVERHGKGWRVKIGERTLEVDSTVAAGAVRSLLIAGRQFEVAVRPAGQAGQAGDCRYLVSSGGDVTEVEVLDPLTHLARESRGGVAAGGPQQVAAYMPGRVTAVLVATGESVESGHGVVVLEAMKMENEIQAERSGVIGRIFVSPGQAVEAGDPLFEIVAG